MRREILVSPRCVATRLERMAWPIKPKAEHRIALTTDRAYRREEPTHFLLREDENLRRPPSANLPPLRCVDRGIQRDQTEEVRLRRAVEIIEPGVVPKWPPGS